MKLAFGTPDEPRNIENSDSGNPGLTAAEINFLRALGYPGDKVPLTPVGMKKLEEHLQAWLEKIPPHSIDSILLDVFSSANHLKPILSGFYFHNGMRDFRDKQVVLSQSCNAWDMFFYLLADSLIIADFEKLFFQKDCQEAQHLLAAQLSRLRLKAGQEDEKLLLPKIAQSARIIVVMKYHEEDKDCSIEEAGRKHEQEVLAVLNNILRETGLNEIADRDKLGLLFAAEDSGQTGGMTVSVLVRAFTAMDKLNAVRPLHPEKKRPLLINLLSAPDFEALSAINSEKLTSIVFQEAVDALPKPHIADNARKRLLALIDKLLDRSMARSHMPESMLVKTLSNGVSDALTPDEAWDIAARVRALFSSTSVSVKVFSGLYSVNSSKFPVISVPPGAKEKRDELFELIKNPEIIGFYYACGACAQLALDDDQFASDVGVSLFGSSYDLIDPARGTALRYMLEAIPDDDERAKFFKTILGCCRGEIPLDYQSQLSFVQTMSMLSDICTKKTNPNPAGDTKEPPLEESFVLPPVATPDRDIHGLYKRIIDNRSINISSKGNIFAETGADSDFEQYVETTKITPNKDSRKCPKSLACHVTLRFRNGFVLYTRMTPEGELRIRKFENGNFVGENSLAQVSEAQLCRRETLDELHYFVLRKLEALFVRKIAEVSDTVEEISPPEAEEAPPSTLPSPPDKPLSPLPDGPPSDVRNETVHAIDLTVPLIESEMGMDPLGPEPKNGSPVATAARRQIDANREKVLLLLLKLYTDEPLPEKLPEELEEMIIYQKLVVDGEDYYEAMPIEKFYARVRACGIAAIDPKEYFIRKQRAHTVALPYIKLENPSPLNRQEARRVNEITNRTACAPGEARKVILSVKTKERREDEVALKMALFASSGESYGLDMSPKNKILYFDVNDEGQNRQIFDALKSRTPQEIMEQVEKRVIRALKRNIRLARKKIVRPELTGDQYQAAEERFARICSRMKRVAVKMIDAETALERKLQSRLVKKVKKDTSVPEAVAEEVTLRLPQVFPFEQTFNHGQFVSLEELAKEFL